MLVICMLVLFGSWGKPIWIDEFVHFAIGAQHSTVEALEAIYLTTAKLNHGQTGFYILLDYWLLKIFGANLWALRLPSLLSALWVLLSGILLLRTRGFGWSWLYLLVLSAMGQSTFISFAAEARTYMPLAAASAGTLAYYMIPIDARRQPLITLFGWASVFWGVLMHPYFSIYWAAIWLYSYWYQCWQNNLTFGFRTAFTHVNLKLSILGTFVFFLLGSLTWMKRRADLGFDPFRYISIDIYIPVFLNHSHFEFVRPLGGVIIAGGTTLLVLTFAFLGQSTKENLRSLVPASALIVVAMLLSIVLSLISFFSDYWILQRQWLASMGLVTIGVVWLIAEASRIAYRTRPIIATAIYPAFLLYVVIMLLPGIWGSYQRLDSYWKSVAAYAGKDLSPQVPEEPLRGNAAWVAAAKENLKAGGEVWPVFKSFYDQHNEAARRVLDSSN